MLLALLLLPAAEIAAFYAVASAIGFLPALALFLGTSLIGLTMLRRDGIARIFSIGGTAGDRVTALELQAAGFVMLVAGALLVVPGFITDTIGLMLLIAPRAVSRALLRRLFAGARRRAPSDDVVDLDRDQWEQVPDRPIEDRRRGKPDR